MYIDSKSDNRFTILRNYDNNDVTVLSDLNFEEYKGISLSSSVSRRILLTEAILEKEELLKKEVDIGLLGNLESRWEISKMKSQLSEVDLEGVYLVRQRGSDFFKIGKSNNILKRIASLQTGNPNRLELIFYFDIIEDPFSYEQYLHDEYSDRRVGGEWFKLKESDVHNMISDYAGGLGWSFEDVIEFYSVY